MTEAGASHETVRFTLHVSIPQRPDREPRRSRVPVGPFPGTSRLYLTSPLEPVDSPWDPCSPKASHFRPDGRGDPASVQPSPGPGV